MSKEDFHTWAEEHFTMHCEASAELNVDVLSRQLKQIYATLMLLQGDGFHSNDGFELRHDIVMDAIDGVIELTGRAIQTVNKTDSARSQ